MKLCIKSTSKIMKFFQIIFLLSIASNTYSQVDKLPKPTASFYAIIVSDIEASSNWYSKAFGFEVLNKMELEERGIKQANLKCGNTLLELIELDNSLSQDEMLENRQKGTKMQGFFKFGLTVAEFDKWFKHLNTLKVEFNGTVVNDPDTNKKMVIVKDPDGNRIQLFEQ